MTTKNMRILPLLLVAAFVPGMSNAQSYVDKLKTQDENSIGITFSNYKYKEPSIGMSLKAINFGIEYFGSRRINSEYFGMVEIDYNSGKQDYRSDASGTINDIPTKYLNAKIAIGQDFSFGSYVLSPYAGFGYRHLEQSGSGIISSTGDVAYDRNSTYKYIPIGVIHRFNVDNNANLVTTFEYNYLLSGSQFSGLSVLNNSAGYSGVPDAKNNQNSGYGINLTVMYKTDTWSVGPYYKYWNIEKSDISSGTFTYSGTTYSASVYEPKNNTSEFGVKFAYQF